MPNLQQIPTLLHTLANYPNSALVTNPYQNTRRCDNLHAYLTALVYSKSYVGDLLAGEAPGRDGCALTGIPFTSEHVIQSSNNLFICGLRQDLKIGGVQREQTATIVWDYLLGCSSVPALWNIFPFHPHHRCEVNKPLKNRKPTSVETQFGYDIINLIVGILTPKRMIAVGKTAFHKLSQHKHNLLVDEVRHPANGGKTEFVAAMKKLGI